MLTLSLNPYAHPYEYRLLITKVITLVPGEEAEARFPDPDLPGEYTALRKEFAENLEKFGMWDVSLDRRPIGGRCAMCQAEHLWEKLHAADDVMGDKVLFELGALLYRVPKTHIVRVEGGLKIGFELDQHFPTEMRGTGECFT